MTGVYYCDPFITATHCHILGDPPQRFDKCAIRTRKHPWRYAFGNLQFFPKTHSRSHEQVLEQEMDQLLENGVATTKAKTTIVILKDILHFL